MLTPIALAPGDQVHVRLSVNERRGEGLRTITRVLVADSRGRFYELDEPVDCDGVKILQVYEDELEREKIPAASH